VVLHSVNLIEIIADEDTPVYKDFDPRLPAYTTNLCVRSGMVDTDITWRRSMQYLLNEVPELLLR
jgi:hypothetical protein